MSAECNKHGVDLHGDTHSGLVCPVCEAEAERDEAERRAKVHFEDAQTALKERKALADALREVVQAGERLEASFQRRFEQVEIARAALDKLGGEDK